MKVKITEVYLDTTMNSLISVGTVLDVPAERAKVLIEAKVAVKHEDKKEDKKIISKEK